MNDSIHATRTLYLPFFILNCIFCVFFVLNHLFLKKETTLWIKFVSFVVFATFLVLIAVKNALLCVILCVD